MLEGVGDAAFEQACDLLEGAGAVRRLEITPDHVQTERKRTVRPSPPPVAEILEQMKPVVREGELALVDDHTGIDLAREDAIADLFERGLDLFMFHARHPQAEGQGRRGPTPGCRDPRSARREFVPGQVGRGDQLRAVALAHRGSAGGDRVSIRDPGELAATQCGDLQQVVTGFGPAIRRFDVDFDLLEAKPGRSDRRRLAVDAEERPPHEGVVGVGAVAEAEHDGLVGRHRMGC